MLFAMLVIALCGCLSMQMNDGDEVSHIALIYLATFAVLSPGLLLYFKTRIVRRSPWPIAWLTTLFFWMILVTAIMGISDIRAMIFNLLRILITLSALCLSYDYIGRYGLYKHIYWMSVGVMVLLLLQYVNIYLSANLWDVAHLITSYYPLFMLPLVLMHPSKWIRYIFILLVIIAIFSSVKRGGLVALALSLIVYIFCKRRIESKGIKTLLYTLFAVGILAGIFVSIAFSEYGEVIDRLMNIGDDGGSGRTDVWAMTWQMISESNIFHILIGHGSNAVLNDSPLELSAHNDLLEAWYDYGLIGVSLYLISLCSLFFYTKSLIRKKSSVAPSLAMLLTQMAVLTMISHVLIYYFMTLCCLTIGILVGQHRHDEHGK